MRQTKNKQQGGLYKPNYINKHTKYKWSKHFQLNGLNTEIVRLNKKA